MSMLKDEIRKVCIICGKEADSGVHVAIMAQNNLDVRQEIISHCCNEHTTQTHELVREQRKKVW